MPEDPPADACASKAKTSYDLIVLASSAGGIEPLLVSLSGPPHDFPAALIAVQHLHPDHKSHLILPVEAISGRLISMVQTGVAE